MTQVRRSLAAQSYDTVPAISPASWLSRVGTSLAASRLTHLSSQGVGYRFLYVLEKSKYFNFLHPRKHISHTFALRGFCFWSQSLLKSLVTGTNCCYTASLLLRVQGDGRMGRYHNISSGAFLPEVSITGRYRRLPFGISCNRMISGELDIMAWQRMAVGVDRI